MTSKTVDEFENKTKIPMTRDTSRDDFVNPGVSEEEKNQPVEVKGLDTVVYKGDPDPTPESTQMRVPEFIENYMTQNKYIKDDIIADDSFGIGSVEQPNEITLDAVKNLKRKK